MKFKKGDVVKIVKIINNDKSIEKYVGMISIVSYIFSSEFYNCKYSILLEDVVFGLNENELERATNREEFLYRILGTFNSNGDKK